AEGAEPERAATAGDRPYLVAAHSGVGVAAVVAEAVAAVVQHAQAARFGGDPDPVPWVDMYRGDDVSRQGGRVGRLVAPRHHLGAVMPRQSVGRRQPDVAIAIFDDAVDRA